MDSIFYKKTLVGIRVRKIKKGTNPVTHAREALQMLTLKHSRGAYLVAHTHAPKARKTQRLQECLIVRKGKIRVELYGPDKKHFKNIILKQGEAFTLLRGGYGIRVLEDAEMLELKNGPYIEDKQLIV